MADQQRNGLELGLFLKLEFFTVVSCVNRKVTESPYLHIEGLAQFEGACVHFIITGDSSRATSSGRLRRITGFIVLPLVNMQT